MDKRQLKAVGIIGTIILIINMLLFAFGIITPVVFWVIIIAAALFVWKGLPILQQN